jgi:hypothetical protein
MENFRARVSVNGIISEKSRSIIDKGFKVNGDQLLTLNLFCWYAEFDIKIGATFNCFEKNNMQMLLKKEAVLIAVTQQVGKPFELIPAGWKTISKFEFCAEDVYYLKRELPILDSWTFIKDEFYLLRIE